jgi:hypothetical protein
LAEQTKQPSRYSIRLIEFLKDINQHEASIIERLKPFALDGAFIFVEQDKDLGVGLTFPALLELQSIGILSGIEAIGMTLNLSSQISDKSRFVFRCGNKILAIEHDEPGKSTSIPGFSITRLGMEVLSLCHLAPDLEYLKKIAAYMTKNGFTVRLGDGLPVEGGFRLFNVETFEPSA